MAADASSAATPDAALGSSLEFLLDGHTDVEDVRLACSYAAPLDAPNLPACVALASVASFLGEADSEARCERIVELLLDDCARRHGSSRRKRIGLLLRWLLTHPELSSSASAAIVACLNGEASLNRLKLAAAWTLQASSAARSTSGLPDWPPRVLVQLVRALGASSRTPTPTKLSAAAADATVSTFSEICHCATRASGEEWHSAMRQCATDARALLGSLAVWRRGQLAFVTATEELSRALDGAADGGLVDAAHLWLHCAPLLLCEGETASAHRLRGRVGRWLERLRDPGVNDEIVLRNQQQQLLCGLALQIDSLSPDARSSVIAQAAPGCYPILSQICRSSNQDDAALPLALMITLLPTLTQNGQEAAVVLQPLLDLIRDSDTASPAVVRLTAQLALMHPELVLPDVCAVLASPVLSQRENARAILASVSELADLGRLLGRERSERLLDTLMLQLFADENQRVVSLVAALDLSIVLPRLTGILAAPLSARPLATAPLEATIEEAMLVALSHSADPAVAIGAVIDTLRDSSSTHAPGGVAAGGGEGRNDLPSRVSHPGQIGPSSSTSCAGNGQAESGEKAGVPTAEDEKVSEAVLLRTTRRWANQLPPDAWASVLRMGCTKFFAAAQDTCSMHVLKALLGKADDTSGGDGAGGRGGVTDADCAARHSVVARAAINRIASTRSATEGTGKKSSPAVEGGEHEAAAAGEPFDRLRPLLLLQLLPEDSWRSAQESKIIEASEGASGLDALVPVCRAALTSCIDDGLEIQPVRKLAASLLARLPPRPSAELMWSRLRRAAASPHDFGQQTESALALYYLCCAVLLHPEVAGEAADDEHAPVLIDLLLTKPASAADGGGEAPDRLQRGAMDCIARLLCAPFQPPLMQKLSGRAKLARPPLASVRENLTGRILLMLDAPDTTTHAVTIVGLGVRMLHARGGGKLAWPLVQAWLPALLERQGAQITNALFDLAFHAQPFVAPSSLATLFERARSDASSTCAATRAAALKLTGVAFADLEHAAPPEAIEPMLHQLHGLSKDDPSREVRMIAQRLLSTALGSAAR